MSKEIETGGPAFPSTNQVRIGDMSTSGHAGLDLRDYFASKAMQAMLSSPNCPMKVDNSELAKISYEVADAMLEARK